ncbi:HET-domain-containing protein [Cubamyces sp. BRFM 1775]|nr:HET-domain-containing protein [Cubamyces sp. BRFM 1775]
MGLPPKPPHICTHAWEGVFAARFGLVGGSTAQDSDPKLEGLYQYTVSSTTCDVPHCVWCRLLAKHFRLSESPCWSYDHTSRVQVRAINFDASSRFEGRASTLRELMVSWVPCCHSAESACFRAWTTADDPAATYVKARTRIPHIGRPSVLAIAKTRVEECDRAHAACQAITHDPVLPRRLVDCSDPLHVRIIETDSSMREQYVALSYVWGGDQPHRTRKSNLASYMREGIDPATLPQTIQDAIRVTRALGVRFLWLDSLCIIQDSEEDKHREVASMCDVYRHAYVTIDAARAASVVEGFLHDGRALDPDAMYALPFICPDLEDRGLEAPRVTPADRVAHLGTLYLSREMPGSADRTRIRATKRDTRTDAMELSEASETGRRGWCLQESLLSPRFLVFTSETLQLRCHTTTQNIGGAYHDRTSDLPRLPDAVFRHDPQLKRGSDEWTAVHRTWRSTVEDCSRRSLSYSSDKLLACSAVVGMFAPVLGPDYVAGLWRDTILYDLLWWRDLSNSEEDQFESPVGRHGPLRDECAPSWSWASCGGPIQHVSVQDDMFPYKYQAEVMECTVAPEDEKLPYGPVQVGGELILRAKVFERRRYNEYIVMEKAGAASNRASNCAARTPAFARCSFFLSYLHFDSQDGDHLEELWMVALAAYNNGWSPRAVNGLVVARADPSVCTNVQREYGTDRDVYRRVGHFRGECRDDQVDSVKNFDNAPCIKITLI